MLSLRRLASAASLSLAAAFSAHAAPLAVDNLWSPFDFDGPGSAWYDINTLAPLTFQFTLTAEAVLSVVDGGFAGDRFFVLNDNVFLGLTSMPGDGGPLTYIDDFDAAFADARWSQFSTVLQPGLYNLTGIATEAPLGGGVGGIRLSELPPAASVIPVPGALGLMLSGIALVGCALRTRRSNA